MRNRSVRFCTVGLEHIPCRCRLGAHSAERKRITTVYVDLRIRIDGRAVIAEDRLCRTVDYTKLDATVKRVAGRKEWITIESLAGNMLLKVLEVKGIQDAEVTLCKRNPPGLCAGTGARVTMRSGNI